MKQILRKLSIECHLIRIYYNQLLELQLLVLIFQQNIRIIIYKYQLNISFKKLNIIQI